MNKREFVAGGVAAAVAAPVLARPADVRPAGGALRELMTRTQRLPDLAERAGADAFEAYVGERFDIVAGAGSGQQLVLESVERVSRCAATEQFNVAFAPQHPNRDRSRNTPIAIAVRRRLRPRSRSSHPKTDRPPLPSSLNLIRL